MTTAEKIIEKCGGVRRTAELVGSTTNWVYRWRLAKTAGGTGGHVPAPAQRALVAAGRAGLVEISPADFFPDSDG